MASTCPHNMLVVEAFSSHFLEPELEGSGGQGAHYVTCTGNRASLPVWLPQLVNEVGGAMYTQTYNASCTVNTFGHTAAVLCSHCRHHCLTVQYWLGQVHRVDPAAPRPWRAQPDSKLLVGGQTVLRSSQVEAKRLAKHHPASLMTNVHTHKHTRRIQLNLHTMSVLAHQFNSSAHTTC